jgi:hypothetical protein
MCYTLCTAERLDGYNGSKYAFVQAPLPSEKSFFFCCVRFVTTKQNQPNTFVTSASRNVNIRKLALFSTRSTVNYVQHHTC